MKITETAQAALNKIIAVFESGIVPVMIAKTILPAIDVPCNRWSFNNRLLTFLSDTEDARGINQWREVGRFPKKGSKAVYILAPMVTTKKDKDEEGSFLYGFRAVPVFRYEDTDGESIVYPDHAPTEPPLLLNLAKKWNIKVEWRGFTGKYFGAFSPTHQKIVMATHDEGTFFHEMAHAAHQKVKGGEMVGGQDWRQEVVAELTAATLAHFYGRKTNEGYSFQYISNYAASAGKSVSSACMAVLADTEKCIALIIGNNNAHS